MVLELPKTQPTALGSSREACLPLLLPLGNACASGMLKLASQLCSTLAQEPQSPGTARQPGLPRRKHPARGNSSLLMHADSGRAAGEPFSICLPLSLCRDHKASSSQKWGQKGKSVFSG